MKPIQIGALPFRNPTLTASGTFGMGDEMRDFLDYTKIGGITLKTVTRHPRKGNLPPRILELPCGLMNSIGLENDGFTKTMFDLKTDPSRFDYDTNVIFSFAGDTVEDYVSMAQELDEIDAVDMLELNLSCPNVHEGGITFDSNCRNVEAIVKGVAERTEKPFSVKLSPQSPFQENAGIAESWGASAVTISNTFRATAFDLKTRDFVFRNKAAGYSGPAVKPIALYNVYLIAQTVKIPVIASGGICSGEDAVEFLLAGATLVSVGTMNFVEPDIAEEIAEYIENYFKD